MLKQIQVQLHPPERPHWHGDIKKHWRSYGVFIVNFEKIPQLFLVLHCWIWESVASCIYQQRSKKRQEKITKHASTGTNYAILTKLVKVQLKKKTCIELKKYADCSFWANIYEIYWDFRSVRIVEANSGRVETIQLPSMIVLMCFVLTYI